MSAGLECHSSERCPASSDGQHRIVEIHASREGYWERCGRCKKGWYVIDLRPKRQEIRDLGGDPDQPILG